MDWIVRVVDDIGAETRMKWIRLQERLEGKFYRTPSLEESRRLCGSKLLAVDSGAAALKSLGPWLRLLGDYDIRLRVLVYRCLGSRLLLNLRFCSSKHCACL